MRYFKFLFCILMGWAVTGVPFWTCFADSRTVASPHVKVEMLAETQSVQPGTEAWIGFSFEIEDGWHLYWKNPGDSGDSPRIVWQKPEGFSAGEVQWPIPKRLPTSHLMNYGYTDSLFLLIPIQISQNALPEMVLHARMKWLVCREVCVPEKMDLELKLPVKPSKPEFSFAKGLFRKARSLLPLPFPTQWKTNTDLQGNHFVLSIEAPGLNQKISHIEFFPLIPNQIENRSEQKWKRQGNLIQMKLPKSTQPEEIAGQISGVFQGLLTIEDRTYEVASPVNGVSLLPHANTVTHPVEVKKVKSPERESVSVLILLRILLFAFFGGLILNLMPCVFPVLSLKAVSLLEQAREQKSASIRIHGIVYTLGVVVSFWALSLAISFFRLGGERLGWGFQLQSPLFVTVLSNLLFLMALSLLGIFEIGTSMMGMGQSLTAKKGYQGSFFTGVLATVVATPCTAPFMGTALAFASSQSWITSLLVFTFLGLGLAAPYILFSFVPSLGKILPKPGQWMETFKQSMAFPLLGTIIWLLWILGLETEPLHVTKVLVSLLVMGMGAWIYGHRNQVRWKQWGILFILIGFGIDTLEGTEMEPEKSLNQLESRAESPVQRADSTFWQPYSAKKVEDLIQAGKPVFIDFTAAWCVTCKINEKIAFTPKVMQLMTERGVNAFKADWTKAHPEITHALESYGRNGVPLYVLYSTKIGDSPQILPQILTPNIVLEAIENAAPLAH